MPTTPTATTSAAAAARRRRSDAGPRRPPRWRPVAGCSADRPPSGLGADGREEVVDATRRGLGPHRPVGEEVADATRGVAASTRLPDRGGATGVEEVGELVLVHGTRTCGSTLMAGAQYGVGRRSVLDAMMAPTPSP